MHLYRKTVLKIPVRVCFDASNEDHLRDYAKFVKTNNWKNGCQYLLEDPYHDIPSMINAKVVEYFLGQYA
jgi:hypothetical protein